MAKKRKGRGIDHFWQFIKYKGDCAYYAGCSCGFRYACYKNELGTVITTPAPEKLYNYCPNCGARKTRYYEEAKKIDSGWWDLVGGK